MLPPPLHDWPAGLEVAAWWPTSPRMEYSAAAPAIFLTARNVTGPVPAVPASFTGTGDGSYAQIQRMAFARSRFSRTGCVLQYRAC
jgi:hypothetical protein